ncbi:glycoside hydrolase family 97 protein [Roseibacillus persicicus]|uniref:glycoside hydrolase family 97 protein n=1 Tax=Roseibacillus persicicus TaxID=454148 RepID=UPI0028100060|nr:glycoside hydrolase family 97 catalytic domain-containing protein [Roseibacillus persicicus]MDQ8189788.1 glycoside hydrolase family 97 catalytic domain-containing protein [Roseibacillus persicicus]
MKIPSAFYLPLILLPSLEAKPKVVNSPDERIQLQAHAENNGLFYSVTFNGQPIIGKSRLGVELNQDVFAGGVTVTQSATRSFDETWKPVWGQASEYRNHFNELTLDLQEVAESKRTMQVVLRAFDDGVALRYVYPEQEGLPHANLKKELTEVSVISQNPVAWYAKSSTGLFSNLPFAKLGKSCRTPFTAQLAEDCFISLHEAGVVNSSDANLIPEKDRRTLRYSSVCNQGAGSVSPWRTIQIASTPGKLIESSLILNLNEPNRVAKSDWIKPGVSLWDWRNHGGKADDGFEYGINTESYLRYIDFAHQQGLAYVLIDADWYGPERDDKSDPTTYEHEVDIPRITSYAKEKGVGIWVYVNDKGLKLYDIDRTFAQFQKWGIVGIKHGFLGAGNQTKNAFSVEVLKKCAEYEIMYNLHEPNKPTGLNRTYPHYMSREYVNSMLDAANRPPATPSELCVFPVVHNLAGPVDRSCGLFDMDQSIGRAKVHKQIPSTVVSQVAQCLVFPSGILTLPDMPDAYRRKLDLFGFIKSLPMTYDETRVLEMEIGKKITMARRSGDTWFVAALVDEKGRQLELDFDFLEAGVKYEVQIFEDTAESHYQFPGGWNQKDAAKKKIPFKPVETKRELYQVRSKAARKGDKYTARLAPGGGHCLILKPVASN